MRYGTSSCGGERVRGTDPKTATRWGEEGVAWRRALMASVVSVMAVMPVGKRKTSDGETWRLEEGSE